jgi:stage II sporulation protein M
MFIKIKELLQKHIKENIFLYLLVVLSFLIGISAGAFTVKAVDQSQKQDLLYYLKDFFQLFNNNQLKGTSILRQSVINNTQLFILSWSMGVLIITAPLVLVIVGFKGFVIGFTVGLLIEEFKLLGALLFLLGVFPQNLIIIPVFMIGAVVSMSFSFTFIKSKLKKTKQASFAKGFVLYSAEYGVLMICIFIACLIESFIAPVFIGLLARFL